MTKFFAAIAVALLGVAACSDGGAAPATMSLGTGVSVGDTSAPTTDAGTVAPDPSGPGQ